MPATLGEIRPDFRDRDVENELETPTKGTQSLPNVYKYLI
jgi:hypothetical protein